MAIDKTKRPLRIPPQFQLYAEEHGLFDLYHRMLQRLVIDKPDDPLDYMINWLRRESDAVPKIAVIGAPAGGKASISKKLSDKSGAVLVEASTLATTDEEIISELKDRLTALGSEPLRRGFVLNNVPNSRKQALLLQQIGIHPQHIISLDAPEQVLLGRRLGKYIDEATGQRYHNVYDWPPDIELQGKLTKAPNAEKDCFEKDMARWQREKVGIFDAYKEANVIFHVNSDQPINDVTFQSLQIVQQPPRSDGILIPRVVLLGPIGSGKQTLAKYLVKKYKMVEVDADAWIKAVTEDKSSTIGDQVRQWQDDSAQGAVMPDDLIVRCVNERLCRMDCQTKGWILYGFPKNSAQAESMNMLGHRPNKVFSLELPLEGCLERLTNRCVDPVTGKRYHLLWNAPENQEIMDRVLHAPYDKEDIINSKYHEYSNNVGQIKQVYLDQEKQLEKPTGGIFVAINADQDVQTVAEYGESMLINPVPINPNNR